MLLNVLEIFQRELGEDHAWTANAFYELGRLRLDQDRLEEAGSFFEDALVIQREQYISTHFHIANSLAGLGAVAMKRKQFDQADALLREALTIRGRAFPDGHPLTAEVQNLLAECLTEQGRFAEAERLLLSSLPVIETTEREIIVTYPDALRRMIGLYEAWGKPAEIAKYDSLLMQHTESRREGR